MMQINYLAQKQGKFGFLRISGNPCNPIPLGTNIQASKDALVKGLNVLEKIEAPHYVSAGTVLGIVRDKGFIPHDTDLDIEIITSYEKPIDYVFIHSAMSYNGFTLIRTVFDFDEQNQIAYPKQLAYITKDNVVFDLWFVYTDVEEDYVVTFSEYGKMKTPLHMVTDLKKNKYMVEGEELELLLPNELEDYCEMRYGSDWRTPKTFKGPWQDDAGNIE